MDLCCPLGACQNRRHDSKEDAEVLDRELNASPRTLNVSGEFYAVWGLPSSCKAWKAQSYEHYHYHI